MPYRIRLDNRDEYLCYYDNDQQIKKSSKPYPKLRFKRGDRVDCNINHTWVAGAIECVWHDIGKDMFGHGNVVPYVIYLDHGK